MLPTADDPLTVLVVSDDPLARGGLRAMLDAAGGIEIAGAAPSDAPLPRPAPDALLWDLGPNNETAGEPEGVGDLPTLALVSGASAARTARSAGALGIVGRALESDRVVAALIAVSTGLTVIAPELTEHLLSAERELDDVGLEPLTGREQEVLALMAEGLANRDVAMALDISESTAKFHVRSILNKLGAATRTEAVVRAMRAGLLEL